jgi:protein farnesyltransferase subunit beta
LKACQHPGGGFSGGHGQIAHLAPTYAAVNTLALFGGDEAFEAVNREKLYEWLLSLKQSDGGFLMHHGGEEDARYPAEGSIIMVGRRTLPWRFLPC